MSTSRTINQSSLSRLPSWIAGGLVSVVLAFSASYIGIQRGQAVMDTRVATAERDIKEAKQDRDRLQEQTIPRREFDAYMKSIKESLDDFKKIAEQNFLEIKQDIKDIRNRAFQK
jgi:coenzyme F420-reducing hydrogenase delta subunit